MRHAASNVCQMSSPADQPSPENGRDSTVASRVEQLYRSHVALVRSVCRSLLRDRVEAEDAVQQTFLSAQRALMGGSAPRNAAAWLAAIARNESLARVRARMREPLSIEIDGQGATPDVHVAALHRSQASELLDALAQLRRGSERRSSCGRCGACPLRRSQPSSWSRRLPQSRCSPALVGVCRRDCKRCSRGCHPARGLNRSGNSLRGSQVVVWWHRRPRRWRRLAPEPSS
jgi:RNA polymerase sigma factor (sigma-70 family)